MSLKKLKYLLLLVFGFIFVVSDKFVEDPEIKFFLNLISVVGVIPVGFRIIFDHLLRPRVRRNIIRKANQYPLIKFLVDIEVKPSAVTTKESVSHKIRVLHSMGSKVSKLREGITQESIFTIDFDLDILFTQGWGSFNEDEDWLKDIDQDVFQVVLGESGYGKSFELLKRFLSYHRVKDQLKRDDGQMKSSRVPVFIELKSLEGEFSLDSIFSYLSKKENGKDAPISDEDLKGLIFKNQLVYFLDGLDEVEEGEREDYYEEIIQLSLKTSVFFTCRKEIFLKIKENRPSDYFPAEFSIVPLDVEKMIRIVQELQSLNEPDRLDILEFIQYINTHPQGKQLIEHLSVPLIFNLFIKVFPELSKQEREHLMTGSQTKLLSVLWEKYEDKAAERKISPNKNDPRVLKFRTYTVWLAKINGNESFLIEKIQPDWLKILDSEQKAVTSLWQKSLYFIVTRILTSVLLGIAVGLIIATPFAFLGNSIVAGIVVTVVGAAFKALLKRFKVKRGEEKWSFKKWVFIIFFVIIMVLLLAACCGIYQGYSVPRGDEDMQTSTFSLAETFGGIVLSFVFGLIFTFRIIIEYDKGQYILPVEKLEFNWRHAVTAGIIWGSVVGLVIGTLGLIVKHYFATSSFFSRWLKPYLEEIIFKVRGKGAPSVIDDLILFLFALFVAFSVAFLIIALLAGRNANSESTEEERRKKQMNFGIRASAMYGAMHAFWITITVGALYSILLLRLGMESFWSGLSISIGIGMISYLWFGGIEIINHFVLRMKLHIMGIAPFMYASWYKHNQDMALIKGSGAYLSFYHKTLSEYFANYSLRGNQRVTYKSPNRDWPLYLLFVLLATCLIVQPFIKRYYFRDYWSAPNQISIVSRDLKPLTDSTYLVLRTGKMIVKMSGKIHLGTFTGFSSPKGVTTGFLGMPLKKAYNRSDAESFRHAALLFRTKTPGGRWEDYQYLTPALHDAEETYWKFLTKGNIIRFIVNDREWQNNSGYYRVDLKICEKCKD